MLAGWRMAGKALHQRVSAVRMMSSMWLTEDVVARRMDHNVMTAAERTLLSKCALCGQVHGEGQGEYEHLLFECTSVSVVKLRKELEAAVEEEVSRLVKPGPVREAIVVPWRLDSADRPPNVGVMAEVDGGSTRHSVGCSTGHSVGCCNTSRRVQWAGGKARYQRGDRALEAAGLVQTLQTGCSTKCMLWKKLGLG